jgi:hypothetical protein
MLPLSLATIDEAFLRQLCESECPESQTLDFKRELPETIERDKSEPDKKKIELCKDVVAFANADGGHFVYGIQEKAGVANDIVPITTTESADAAERRIRHVLDARIEPKIHGLTFHKVEVAGGYVLILRVPASYDGPHGIRISKNKNNNNQWWRFVMRNGTMVSDMSYDQIRGAFDRTATLAEQARRFIATRRELIAKGETPVRLISDRPHFVVHLMPISGLAGRMTVDLTTIYERSWTDFIKDLGGSDRGYNLDGLLVHSVDRGDGSHYGYRQIFRNGILEGVILAGSVTKDSQGNQKSIVGSSRMSEFFYYSTKMFVEKIKRWGFSGPVLFGFSILNVKDYEFWVGGGYNPYIRPKEADRQHLIPSEVWIEDIEAVDDDGLIDNVIRPLLDTLWQAFGVERCFDFDVATGKFAPRQR